MPGLTEQCDFQQFPRCPLRSRQFRSTELEARRRVAFQGTRVHIGEATAPRLGPRRVGLGQEPSACHEQRGQRGRPRPPPVLERDSGLGRVQRRGGHLDVDVRRLGQGHRQLASSLEHVRPDRCPYLGDQGIERGACGGGRVVAPQGVNETVAWNSLRPVQDQVAEQQPALPARKRLVDPPGSM
jgi:hypothetical protein